MVAITFAPSGLAPLVTGGTAPEMYTMAYLLLLPYSLFRWGSGRAAVLGATIIFGKVCLWMLVFHYTGTGDVFGAITILFSVAALGTALRYRARARLRELDQVKLFERERLARDLHDTVAHHVSAMAIRAQAGLATAAA